MKSIIKLYLWLYKYKTIVRYITLTILFSSLYITFRTKHYIIFSLLLGWLIYEFYLMWTHRKRHTPKERLQKELQRIFN